MRALVDLALEKQAAAGTNAQLEDLLRLAQRQYDLGKFTDAQKQLLTKQSIQLAMRIRPRVALGDDVPYEVSKQTRIVSPWLVYVQSGAASIDGKQVKGPESGYGTTSGIGGGGAFTEWLRCKTPGVHRLDATVHIEVRRVIDLLVRDNGDPPAKTLYAEDRVVTGTFEVVAKPPSEFLKIIDDATLAPQIQACITLREFVFGDTFKDRLAGKVELRSVPVNVSFRLIARYGNREHPMATITCNAGKSVTCFVAGDNITDPPPAKIDLILRTDEAAARQTIDQTEVWKGEIVIKDVAVKQAAGK
jgi:hypothetical protein